MKWFAGLTLALVVMVGCAAAPTTAPVVPGTPKSDLAGMLAGKTRYSSLPITIKTVDKDGFSFAQCPGEIQIAANLTPSDPDYLWTIAHEWGHIVGCAGSGSNYYPMPQTFPATFAPIGWQWSNISVWKFEQFADCVALYLTGEDRAWMRDYPECTASQLNWVRNFLTR